MQSAKLAVEDLGAHREATEINERQDDRLSAEIIGEPHRVSGFIAKNKIRRNLLIHLLADADAAKQRRLGGGGLLGSQSKWRESEQGERDKRNAA